jgi:hypothetical protein
MSFLNLLKMRLIHISNSKIGIILLSKIGVDATLKKNHRICIVKKKEEDKQPFLEEKKPKIIFNSVEKSWSNCSKHFGDDF